MELDVAICQKYENLKKLLKEINSPLIACSGGLDSLTLSVIAHRLLPKTTLIVHTKTPSVPEEATERALFYSKQEGWNFQIIQTQEFEDENYLSNPHDRCYYCKTHLYDALSKIDNSSVILSGANVDDVSEYRPGLRAAEERGVRHPFVEVEISKKDIRKICRYLKLPFAELPASPCLGSRLYTGTRVTPERLMTIEKAEQYLKAITGVRILRCRLKEDEMLIETLEEDQKKITGEIIEKLKNKIMSVDRISLDIKPYEPGRAFLVDFKDYDS